MKKALVIFISLLSSQSFCHAQNNKDKDDPLANLGASYENFNAYARKEYEDFRDQANQEYAEFLRKGWKKFEAKKKKPAPKEPITVPPQQVSPEKKSQPLKTEAFFLFKLFSSKKKSKTPEPVAPIPEVKPEEQNVEKPADAKKEIAVENPKPAPVQQYREFSFYGTEGKVRFNDSQKYKFTTCNNNEVADMWTRCSKHDYNNTIIDCLKLRDEHHLCDFAYIEMLRCLGDTIFGKDTNESEFFTAYIYCQSGYQVRIGRSNDKLYLLYGSEHHIYDKNYYFLDQKSFFLLTGNPSSMSICDMPFKGEKPLDLCMDKSQDLKYEKADERTYRSTKYPDLQVTVSVNKNLIKFYNDYPTSMIDDNFLTRWAMYANTPLDESVKQSLYPQLKSHLAGKDELEQVSMLLDLVQNGFTYEYDDKVWGGDRAFFAEETLYYPYQDCEDRSILFSRLVRDLVGLKVVLVFYPAPNAHLSTAVCFNKEVPGDYYIVNNKHFTACDPTYFDAPVGMQMDIVDTQHAQVILLE